MAKKILVLVGGPRKGGNSDTLVDEFIRGAQEAGHNVEKIYISDKNISPCSGCNYCFSNQGSCSIKDDMDEILPKFLAADAIVLCTPVYFYNFCSQLKAVLDRTCCIAYVAENKDFYLVAACEDGMDKMTPFIGAFNGYVNCFKGCKNAGMVIGCNVVDAGAIKGKPALAEAYEMGKAIKQ